MTGSKKRGRGRPPRNPRVDLSRRRFLAGAAGAAGSLILPACGGGGGESSLTTSLSPPPTLPDPAKSGIEHIVVVMMENRSFDHYLGWLPGANGRQAGLTFTDKAGKKLKTQRLAPDWQGCAHPDPDHSWDGGRTQLNGGRCDGFLRSGDNDVFSISYYAEHDLGFIQDAAKEFTTFDRFHCSLMGSTLPNREYMHAATSYGNRDNALPPETQY